MQKAQNTSVKIRNLSDGRIRYYGLETPSFKTGPTRGATNVFEWNPKTGNVRSWYECYDHTGKVNRVHPKTIMEGIMNYTKKEIGERLKNELEKGYNVSLISNWAYELYIYSPLNVSKEINDILQFIFIMEAGSEFVLSEKDVIFLSNILVNNEEDVIQKTIKNGK